MDQLIVRVKAIDNRQNKLVSFAFGQLSAAKQTGSKPNPNAQFLKKAQKTDSFCRAVMLSVARRKRGTPEKCRFCHSKTRDVV